MKTVNATRVSSRRNAGRRAGFTLIELLLSISITAIVGGMAYFGLDAAVSASAHNQRNAERLREINLAMMIMARDLRQAQRRAVRDEQGDYITSFFGNGSGEKALGLTRGGWQNPAGRNRSNMQRVHYHFRDNRLVRESWTVLDRAPGASSFSNTLLSDVNSLQFRFLRPLAEEGENLGSEWHERWMPSLGDSLIEGVGKAYSTYLPVAVDVEMELEDLGRVRRMFTVSAEWPRYRGYMSRNYRAMTLN